MEKQSRRRLHTVIFHKEIEEMRSNPLITIPLFLLPMVMAVIMPVVTILPISSMSMEDYAIDITKIQNASIYSPIPLESLTPKQLLIVLVLNAFIPFFIVIPAVIPAVISAHSFVGEKNARTIEVLLATPITERDLLLGKVLSAFLPSVGASYLSFGLFALTVDILTHPIFGTWIMPDAFWVILVCLLTPLIALLSIMTNVLISTKVYDVRAAQQLGSLVVVPIIVVFVLSATRILEVNFLFLYLFAGVVALLDVLIGYVAVKSFKREKMLVGRW